MVLCAVIYAGMKTRSTVLVLVIRTALAMLCTCADRGTLKFRHLVFSTALFRAEFIYVLITEEGFLVSSCYSLELCIQMLISFLFSFAFHFSSFHSYL